MKKNILIGVVCILLTLGVSRMVMPKNNNNSFLEAHSLQNLTDEQIVDKLDGSTDFSSDFSASIYPDRIMLIDSTGYYTVSLTIDKFYVSIAPYINMTHGWVMHNLTGCRGELTDKEFDISVTDTNGNVIYSETVKTRSNGFVGVWLPKDLKD